MIFVVPKDGVDVLTMMVIITCYIYMMNIHLEENTLRQINVQINE